MTNTTSATQPLIDAAELRELHAAILSAGLAGSRAALMAGMDGGFVAQLVIAASPAAQVLLDIDALAKTGALADGTVPLRIWLDNAALLAGPRVEAAVFARYRDRMSANGPTQAAAAPRSAAVSADQLLDRLGELLPAQLETLIYKLGVPVAYLSGPAAPPATRIIEVLRWAEQSGRLADVARVLAEVSEGPR